MSDCVHEWEFQETYGVWGGLGFGVMKHRNCKLCKQSDRVSFEGEDPSVDVASWVNEDLGKEAER